MTLATQSGFEQDMSDQPKALEKFLSAAFPAAVSGLDFTKFDRIILTGMGSSDYATIPLEIALAQAGLPVWRIQTNRLLEMPQLITSRSLLWMTSQSGRSGEVVALLNLLGEKGRPTLIATTNNTASPLARVADHLLELHSGPENTVSCKSYMNSLAITHLMAARLQGRDDNQVRNEIAASAGQLRTALNTAAPDIEDIAARSLASDCPRFALCGTGMDSATALTGALIMKEAAKVAAEGYVGGEFRHGPMELAGAGLTALLFGNGDRNETLERLSGDLAESGSAVYAISPIPYPGARQIAVPVDMFGRLSQSMHVIQRLCVALAKEKGLVPGEFRFGKKVTAQI